RRSQQVSTARDLRGTRRVARASVTDTGEGAQPLPFAGDAPMGDEVFDDAHFQDSIRRKTRDIEKCLGYRIARFQDARGLDDEALMRLLNVTAKMLAIVRICLQPRDQAEV